MSESVSTVLARFKSETGETVSNMMDLPRDVSVSNLQLICNSILKQVIPSLVAKRTRENLDRSRWTTGSKFGPKTCRTVVLTTPTVRSALELCTTDYFDRPVCPSPISYCTYVYYNDLNTVLG